MKTLITNETAVRRAPPKAPAPSRSDIQRFRLCAILGFGLSMIAASACAQPWQTVDDFQYIPGKDSQAQGLAVAPNGSLFACGTAVDASGASHGLIMASTNRGVTWSSPLDDFIPGGDNGFYYYAGIIADASGNLYAAGTIEGPLTNHWIVRRSADGGVTWSTVDDFAPGGFLTEAHAIAVDALGNVFVAGDADYGNPNETSYWTVRKGVGGTNFSTVESFPTGSSFYTAQAVFAHPTAGIFVAGEAPVIVGKFGNTALEWTVRRSTNGGASWVTVDTFALTNGSSIFRAEAHAIGADPLGNLYVVGRAAAQYKGSAYWHWVVRKTTTNGRSWSTVDDYQLSATGTSAANTFAADSRGNLYVGGWSCTNNGPAHWIVRESLAGANSWSSVDDYTYQPGGSALAVTMAVNDLGNVFVGGAGSSSSYHWLVRKR